MPIRNPFAKRPGLSNGLDAEPEVENKPGFERVDTVGSKASSALSINSGKSQEPTEYKMSGNTPAVTLSPNVLVSACLVVLARDSSEKLLLICRLQIVVSDSGVYLPPSPPEKKGFWPRRSNPSNASTNTTSSIGEFEPFSISRESFDSYRRSFDISARSPVLGSDLSNGRQSLDSKRLPRLPRSAVNERRFEREPPTAEEGFEDVGLNDEQNKPRRKGFFSKFGDQPEGGASSPGITSKFHITGRKRGQSGQGAELGTIDRPDTSGSADVKEVH